MSCSFGIGIQGLREAVMAADIAAVKDLLARVGVLCLDFINNRFRNVTVHPFSFFLILSYLKIILF